MEIGETRGSSPSCQFVCSYDGCQKFFKRRDRLKIHLRTHTGEKPYTCEQIGCTKKYARSTHLLRHIGIAHNTQREELQNGKFPIGGCHKGQTSCKPRLYTCPEKDCGKTFKKHQQLNAHKFEHTQQYPLWCSHEGCGKSFLYPSKLRRHMKYHQGYSCPEVGCKEQFTKWVLLVKHRRMEHPKVTEHKCPTCGLVFRGKGGLRSHQKVHQEDRETYQCPRENCGRAYLEMRNLSFHVKTYHDGLRFCCEHPGCAKAFVTKQKLKLHTLLHDPDRLVKAQCKPKVANKVKMKITKRRRIKNVAAKLSGIDSCTISACEEDDAVTLDSGTEQNTESLAHPPGENKEICSTMIATHEKLDESSSCDRLRNNISVKNSSAMPEWNDVMKSTCSVDSQLVGTSDILSLVELTIVDNSSNNTQIHKHWPDLLDHDSLISKKDFVNADVTNKVEKNIDFMKCCGDNDATSLHDESYDIAYLLRKCESRNTDVSNNGVS
ncbi:hypothetical protein ScPMuIL_010537 [Solemya velum]